ncbi:unnamed protein product, partial [Amoebophrya sp. A120]
SVLLSSESDESQELNTSDIDIAEFLPSSPSKPPVRNFKVNENRNRRIIASASEDDDMGNNVP